MKFSCLQQDLLPILQAVSRSVSAHPTIPVLSNILFSTEGKKLKVAATNLEVGVIKYLPVGTQEPGDLTIPAKILVELISSLPPSQLTIETSGEIMTVLSGKFKATINGISANEFPVIPLPTGKEVSFKKEVFLSCQHILFSAAIDEGRPTLTGILTFTEGGKLNLVATDGFRLAHRQVSLPEGKLIFKNIIPKKTFEELLRIITEEEIEEITISTSDNQNQAIFKLGSTVVSSRLIEGSFPNWEKIIPTTSSTRLVMDKEVFLNALKLASVFAKNEANIIEFNISPEAILVKSASLQLGSQESEIEGQIEGEKLQIAFNCRFLLEAVSNSPASQLLIEFAGPLSPALLKPIGVEGLQFVVMPVKLPGNQSS